jgi:hypothetical protein
MLVFAWRDWEKSEILTQAEVWTGHLLTRSHKCYNLSYLATISSQTELPCWKSGPTNAEINNVPKSCPGISHVMAELKASVVLTDSTELHTKWQLPSIQWMVNLSFSSSWQLKTDRIYLDHLMDKFLNVQTSYQLVYSHHKATNLNGSAFISFITWSYSEFRVSQSKI